MSTMNYNPWFHKYHHYLSGVRNGTRTFNDTKWKTINDRYTKLADTMSSLLDEQPYNVIGNYAGYQQYFDLMTKSNYTFEDLDQSLIETYKATLQNAMGNMMVNTHAVVAKYRFDDKKHVTNDKYNHYYIIDVPFAQMHFGERDEFVRQKLHAFYETESKYFMPSDRFLSDEISKILGFTVICCTNGYMSDDWSVGISEQGFRFRIGWRYSSDVEFMIMKLDDSFVFETTLDTNKLNANREIPYSELGVSPMYLQNHNCIVQISDEKFAKAVVIAPNFGFFTNTGLKITNLQNKTVTDLGHYRSTRIKLRVYVVKYLHEVPGVFPAVNYYDMMSSKYVYTENYDNVVNSDDSRIILQDQHVDTVLPICTPPISLSHVTHYDDRHNIIKKCYDVTEIMESVQDSITRLGQNANTKTPRLGNDETLSDWYMTNVLLLSRNIYDTLYQAYLNYTAGAMMTALIPLDLITEFRTEIEHFNELAQCDPNYMDIQSHTFDMLYGDNYELFVRKISEPIKKPPFSTFGHIQYPDYFPGEQAYVNRPVSEQCLIAIRYNSDDDCWVFDLPKIKHFHGIDNVFYIDTDLVGDELFKIMYLYTDTENPSEKDMIRMSDEQLIDFDLFTQEVDKHMGFIRYWDASNQLMKLTHMFYRTHDPITELAIITKVMKRKIGGEVFLNYASEINYEPSNASSDFIDEYTEDSMRAPFAINFLFYTLSMFYGNKNRMQSFLMHMITNKKFYPRYADLKLSDMNVDLMEEMINYSVISTSPISTVSTDRENSPMPDTTDLKIFNGIQFPLNPSTFTAFSPTSNVDRYPYVFNTYYDAMPFYMLDMDGVDKEHYIQFENVMSVMGLHPRVSYYDDAQLASIISIFLSEIYDGINEITTNYRCSMNCDETIKSMEYTIQKHTDEFNEYVRARGNTLNCRGAGITTIIEYFRAGARSNPIYVKLDELLYAVKMARGTITSQNPGQQNMTIYDTTQKLLTVLRKTYMQAGFDRYAIPNIRRLYVHLKQIEHKMSLYQYREWLDQVDLDTVDHIQDYLSDNPNVPFSRTEIGTATLNFKACHLMATTHSARVQTKIDDLLTNVQTPYIDTLVAYCDDVVQNYIFDLYVMNKVNFMHEVNGEPAYAEIQISSDDPHVLWEVNPSRTYAMLAKVHYDMSNGVSYISEIIPTCENAFIDGTDATITVVIYDKHGNQISSVSDVPVTFTKVGLSSDIRNNITRYINAQSIPLETQNVHETFDVDGSDIIQERHAELNYELLCGNRFTPLDHLSEYCVPNPHESLQGPIDKMYLSCEQMNKLVVVDETDRPTRTMYFRACDVFHIEPDEGVITSIGGKYFEGQTIYAVTDDGLSIFPMIITTIDHSLERGFVEAKIDTQHTKWFETNDPEVMHKYLTTNIECTVVDDNIRNFLDEFSDYDGPMYIIPELRKAIDGTVVELPGDPLFVQSNSEYVYTRLAWMFDDAPNRFNVDASLRHHFVYIGSGEVVTDDRYILINMINHNFNTFTLPELYQILRSEPDDHPVWHEEREVFFREAGKGIKQINRYDALISQLYHMIAEAETEYRRQELRLELEDAQLKRKFWQDYVNRMDEYREQLESPTTWYNVRAYDDALVYINNGRAQLSKTFIPHVQDIPYADQLDVLLYDWDAKEWINPVLYQIETTTEDNIAIDPYADASTDNVMTTMKITFADESFKSRRILIYFAYETSDVFDNITLNDMTCSVRFQPVLSVMKETGDQPNPYDTIRIRKHYDENEKYTISKLQQLPESFGAVNGFMFERPGRSGLYTTGSPIRFGDMRVITGATEYTFEDFDIYVENPIRNDVNQTSLEVLYECMAVHAAENFESGHTVTMIAVNNDDFSSFDKSASSAMFQAITTDNGIEIQNAVLESYKAHTYVCTILPSTKHHMVGGVYTVMVSSNTIEELNVGPWIHLADKPNQIISTLAHRLIPKRVALLPHEGVILNGSTYIQLSNQYVLDSSHEVNPDNSGDNDLYTYYYDKVHDVRYPIGDVRSSRHEKRLTVDLATNTNVESIRSNFIGVCRYTSQKIPKDGIIDLTGYIPTPLTRDRYEFWVNGRYVYNPDQIIILSPTTFQLRNMTSLKNLDVVELVDDFSPNMINRMGPVYVDFDGNAYCSYLEILRRHANIVDQSMAFMFNQDVHTDMDTYLYDKLKDSHNRDYERDIMSLITLPEVTSYLQLYNIPTLNGVSLFNIRTSDLGLNEIPTKDILHTFDKTWKLEGLNGVTPFKHMQSYVDAIGKKQQLHVRKLEDCYEVYATGSSDECFTLYISTSETGDIDDVEKTTQIIPMIRPGTHVMIDTHFKNQWLHSTIPGTTPIKIK